MEYSENRTAAIGVNGSLMQAILKKEEEHKVEKGDKFKKLIETTQSLHISVGLESK